MASTIPLRHLTIPLQSALLSLEAAFSSAASTSTSRSPLGRQWLRQGFPSIQRQRRRPNVPSASLLNIQTPSASLLPLRSQIGIDDAMLRPANTAAIFQRRRQPHILPSRYFSSSRSTLLAQTQSGSASSSSSTTADAELDKDTSLKGKFKTLMRKYGWATVAVYIIFSAVDFGIAFFAINLVGAEHVRKGQDYVLDTLVYGTDRKPDIMENGSAKGDGILGFLKEWRENQKIKAREQAKESDKGGSSGLAATAVLAYTIHKTLFLPLRLGATAAATPAIVKQLQRWGINIARSPIPEGVKARGAQSLKNSKDRLDRARGKHGDWL